MAKRAFPKDFLWGASTAAHQVEGGNHNQWTEWERANAERLARTAEKRLGWLPDWQSVKAQAEDPKNYISGRGVEHYERYQQDFNILRQLHMNAFRFGIEWARVEPEEGTWDDRAIEHYRAYLSELRERGIEPIPTLWHWTLPVWFAERGGFARRKNVRYFERFVSKIAAEFGASLMYIIVLNEPSVYTSFSYVLGEWPPQKRNLLTAIRVYNNLAYAHRRAYDVLKAANPKLMVGIAQHMSDAQPVNVHNPFDRLQVMVRNYAWNWWFLDRIRRQLDFLGVNFYHTSYLTWTGAERNPRLPVNDLGWYMEPRGLERICWAIWKRYHKPLIITENGVADSHDQYRQWWLEQTMVAMQMLLRRGVDLRGYLHWSLLDNFEWAYGWWPHFGLVAVDRKTMERTIRPSARWLAAYMNKAQK